MKKKQIQIKPEEWTKILENPVQRNTQAHAKKALKNHLKKFSITHARVAAAQLPNGTIYKLDGHTRDYLWRSGELDAPKSLDCDLYQVEHIDEVVELYKCFDNSSAAETAADKLSGAFNFFKIKKHSSIWKIGGVTSALKAIYSSKSGSRIDIIDCIRPFVKALKLIESVHFAHFNFPSPVLTAMILSVHRDGSDALNFWRDYDENLGRKTASKMDAVYCMRDHVRTLREQKTLASGSRNGIYAQLPRLMAIYEKYTKPLFAKSPNTDKKFNEYIKEYCDDVYEQFDRL